MIEVIGKGFTDFQGRETSFLLGNTPDPMSFYVDFNVDFSVTLSFNVTVLKNGNTLSLTNGQWSDFGFVAGSTVTGTYGANTIPGSVTVDFIDGAIMVVTGATLPGSDMEYSEGKISAAIVPDSIEFYFNLVRNSSSGSIYSLIDGEVQRFNIDSSGLAELDPSIAFSQIGNKSGGSTMFPTLERLSDDSLGRRVYRIFSGFQIWTFFPGNIFDANECVKAFIQIEVLPQYNNPSTKLLKTTTELGNTGFLGENFNGITPAYSVLSTTWTTTDDEAMEGMDYTRPSKFTVEIAGFFSASSKFNFGWYYLPNDESIYKNLPNPINNNLMELHFDAPLDLVTPYNLVGNLNSSGCGIEVNDLYFDYSGSVLTVTGMISPFGSFTSYISDRPDDRDFKMWVRCENPTLTDTFINPVNLDLGGTMEKFSPPLGEYEGVSFVVYGHDEEPRARFFTEDDIRVRTQFLLPKDERYTSLRGSVVARNTTEDTEFELENFTIPIDPYPTLTDGTIPINYTAQRNFKLSPENPHNTIVVERNTLIDDTLFYGMTMDYSLLLRWEYWLQQMNANIEFFGSQTKNWQIYQTAFWSVYFKFEIVTPVGTFKNYKVIPIHQYDDWDGTSVFTYFRLDGTPITKPLANEQIRVVCTHTPSDSLLFGVAYKWAQMTIEPTESSPRWDLSSVYPFGNVPQNPLSPLDGEDGVKITVTGTTIVTECLFDPSKVTNPSAISFTGEVYAIIRTKEPADDITFNGSPWIVNGYTESVSISG